MIPWAPCFLLLAGSFFFAGASAAAVPSRVCHQGQCVDIEVVSKEADMERGLMYRNSLGADKGMLFVFPKEDKYRFWMKNMRFGLDMAWLDSEGRIVYISHDVPACTSDPCPVYSSDGNARYVLEVNSGYTDAHHWMVGDKLDLQGV